MKRALSTSLITLVAAGAVALSPATAAADETHTFYGAGWGHGIGYSQYGCYGLSNKGWGRDAILKAYYTGITIGAAPSPPSYIRVGLMNTVSSIRVQAVDGGVQLRVGSTSATPVATIPAGQTWWIEISAAKYRIKKADGTYVGNTSYGGPSTKLFAQYAAVGGAAHLPGTGHTYRRGFIEFNLHQVGTTWYLRAIIQLSPQGYLYGLGEVPSSWPTSTLQAQAIAGRSYAFSKVRNLGQNRPTCNCGLYASTLDQVYVGSDKEDGLDGGRWVAAVDATNNLVGLHGGETIQAFYHSSSGGMTESNEDIWGGSPLPYLENRCDRGDYTDANPNRIWTNTRTGSAIGDALDSWTGTDVGDVTHFSNIERADGGRIMTLTVHGTSGSVTVSGSTFRAATGITSTRFWPNSNRHITGRMRTTYDNLACRPGLPTSPSINVTDGRYMNFEDGRMYANYPNASAHWLEGGAILDKYLSMGAHNSLLGLPTSNVHGIAETSGRKANFDGGRIYWVSATGAHETHGPVLTRYLNEGGPAGPLGFPTTDVVKVGTTQEKQTYQGGSITCTLSSGSCSVSFT